MSILKIEDRTFGLELEFCDLKKDEVVLPEGYGWDKEERSLVNTDGTKVTPTGKIGGEINTRPYKTTLKDIRELRNFIKHCKDKDGKLLWVTGFDLHLYIGDLGLEELKKIFLLGYKMSPFINDVFEHPKWFEVMHLVPVPTYKFAEEVKKAETLEQFKNVFANQTSKGHYRFQVNVMPYFKTKTLEYRFFNASFNFRNTLEQIKFAYSFLDYALTKDSEEIDKIKTKEDFIKAFGIKRKFDKAQPPLIFAESHLENTRQISNAFGLSRRLMSVVKQATRKEIVTVNPYYYEVEIGLYKHKDIHIKNNSEFNHILYQIAKNGLTIEYKDHYEVLNKYKNGTIENELIMFLIFHRIHKYNIDTEYGEKEFKAYIDAIDKSIEKIRVFAKELIDMFDNVVYDIGGINEALEEDRDIVFLQEKNSKTNSTVTALKKHTDYDEVFIKRKVNYYEIDKKIKKNLFVASRNEFLPYTKIAKDMDVILYSTQKSYLGIRHVVEKAYNPTVDIPPDDYNITDKTKIKVQEVKPTFFSILQNRFVKKVSKFTQPRICYIVTADKYILGAFGFDYSKDSNYSLFLLSDFCTNNNIRLLSKFILFIIRTKEVKKLVERKLVEKVNNGYTKVYTARPVSMKYRGAFKKVKLHNKKYLVYEFTFGDIESIKDAVMEYIKRRKS